MKKIQSKLFWLNSAALACLAVFAALAIWNAWIDYRGLADFQRTSRISQAAYALARNLTDERQAGYYASAFLGEGTPAQQLANYATKVGASQVAMKALRDLASDPAVAASARFREAVAGALAVEAPLQELRAAILDPTRPQVQELDSKLKTRALAVYDTVLAAQAVILPTLGQEAHDPELVRRIATQDNIARLQKDLWKVRGLIATALRTDKLTDVSVTEIKLKLASVDEHIARIHSLADPATATALAQLLASDDTKHVLNLAAQLRDLGGKGTGFKALGNLPDYQNGPSARLERAFLDFSGAVSAASDDYVGARLASARRTFAIWSVCCALSVAGLTALMFLVSRSITRPLREVSGQLDDSGARTREAARHFAQSAGQLSDDACAQTAALQEIGDGIQRLSVSAEANVSHMRKLSSLADESNTAIGEGTRHLQQLSTAITAIQRSTHDVAGILKSIDEIAFQTNVLALNAAVEAARAGEAGAGFSVVAEEVRNLAQRSAQAARETADKIASAVRDSEQGVSLARQTETRFREIERITRGHHQIVAEVEQASRHSTEGVGALTGSVSRMDEISRRSAAMAEENAAAAAEMRAQTEQMSAAVSRLDEMLVDRASSAEAAEPATEPSRGAPVRTPQVKTVTARRGVAAVR